MSAGTEELAYDMNKKGFHGATCGCFLAIVGGNWNNSDHVGALYANLNNLASNSNTNIGASQS